MFDDYLGSFDFLKHKFRQLKRRQVILSIPGKLKSKEGMNQKRRNIIKKDMNQKFLSLNRKAFLGELYLGMLYCYNDSNPPTVVNATKNMLDLMHVNLNQKEQNENVGVIRSRLPYYDDSQVSFLSVRQYTGMESAQTYVHIESFNSILQYADILSNIQDKNSLDDENEDGWDDTMDFHDRINYPDDSLGYRIEMYGRQKHILQNNRIKAFYLELLYNHKKYQSKGDSFIDILMTVLRYPIRLSVVIPKSKNNICEQRELLRTNLEKFRRNNPFFHSLYGPIILSVFYKPKKHVNAKDIDNFIREIVAPCFEGEFMPPSRMFAPTKEELDRIESARYCNNLDGHIIGYDILKLPDHDRHNEDEGVCIIGFHMDSHSDVVDTIKSDIDKIIDTV